MQDNERTIQENNLNILRSLTTITEILRNVWQKPVDKYRNPDVYDLLKC